MQIIIRFLSRYGLPAIFLVILLEYACFPVSSEIILPLAGALAAKQELPFVLIILVTTLAGLLGTGICYIAGRIGGQRLIEFLIHRFPKIRSGIESSRIQFERCGVYAVAFGRVIPICRTYIAFIAGAAGMKSIPFFLCSTLGIAVWNSLLTGIGYVLRDHWSYAAAYYSKYKAVLIPVLLVLLLLIFWHKLQKKKNNGRRQLPSP